MFTKATANPQNGGSPGIRRVEADSISHPPSPTQTFDPSLHLSFTPPIKVHTLEELGLSSPLAIGPVAITAPFQLFSAEGVRLLRADLFRPEVMSQHLYRESKMPGIYKIRGYGRDASFVYSAWTNKEVLDACSKAAGVDLQVVMDYEIGHTCVQLPPGMDEGIDAVGTVVGTDAFPLKYIPPAEPPKQIACVTEQEREEAERDGAVLTRWHSDSYPWVCVVMLSDPTGMVGGETALQKGDGEVLKVKGHEKVGSAVMMQGGLITHVALKAMGMNERITMITSFRPKDPCKWDGSNLRNVKYVSNHDKLFEEWTRYRVEVLEKRAEAFKKSLVGLKAKEIHAKAKQWADEQNAYLDTTVTEMTDEGMKGDYMK